MHDSDTWNDGIKAEDIAQVDIDWLDLEADITAQKGRKDFRKPLQDVGNTMKLLSEYPSRVQELYNEYKSSDTRKRNQIKDELWEKHHVLIYNTASRCNIPVLEIEDFSGNDVQFTVEERKRLEKIRLQKKSTKQISISLSRGEDDWIKLAAQALKLPQTTFITRSSWLVAEYVMRLYCDAAAPLFELKNPDFDEICISDLETVSKTLYAAHALRDTQLFTTDEIRKLGLNEEQGIQLGIMIAQKQAGLQGVQKPVSGGEQTA